MNKRTPASQPANDAGFPFSHPAEAELQQLMNNAEHCFGSVKRYACSDLHCQWKSECHEVGSIWMI